MHSPRPTFPSSIQIPISLRRARSAHARASGALLAALLVMACTSGTSAARNPDISVAGASNGGGANVTGSSSVTVGDIISGMNTGHTIATGNTTDGDVTITVDTMSTQSDDLLEATIDPQTGDASGGDYGVAGPGGASAGDIDIKVDSDSKATGGQGGQGGQGGNGYGGDGGDGGTGDGGATGTTGTGADGTIGGSGN